MLPFDEAYYPPEAFNYERYMGPPWNQSKADAKRLVQGMKTEKVYRNDVYQVAVKVKDGGEITHLSIKRIDREVIHDWRDLQEIKNMLCGPEREAVEIYPAESRRVDSANQYHLWVFPEGFRLPFGFGSRLVMDHDDTDGSGAKQRPFTQGSKPW